MSVWRLVARPGKVYIAGVIRVPDRAAAYPGTAEPDGTRVPPGRDCLPNSAVAGGPVQLAPPLRGPRRRGMSLCARHGVTLPVLYCAVLGEQFERARVEPSIALVVDPVEPGLPSGDSIAGGAEPDVGSELGRRADGGVKALAEAALLNQRRLELLRRAVAFASIHGPQPFSPSMGGPHERKRESET
jgi:hypothetical protein